MQQRPALEQLLFYATRISTGSASRMSIHSDYGVSEIYEQDGSLRIPGGRRRRCTDAVRRLNRAGRPLGVAVSYGWPTNASWCCIWAVEPRFGRARALDVNTPVLLKLMHEIRSAARRMRGVIGSNWSTRSPRRALHV